MHARVMSLKMWGKWPTYRKMLDKCKTTPSSLPHGLIMLSTQGGCHEVFLGQLFWLVTDGDKVKNYFFTNHIPEWVQEHVLAHSHTSHVVRLAGNITRFDSSRFFCGFETLAAMCDITQNASPNLTLSYVFEIIDQNKMLGYSRQDSLLAAAHRLFETGP